MSNQRSSGKLYPNPSTTRPASPKTIFGQARYPVLCLNWRGVEKVFVLRPMMAALVGCLAFVITLTTIATGSYIFLQDDIVKATLARKIKMQHLYEDRIAAMRAQVDLVTSRQLLDQRAVENRVTQLLVKQQELGALNMQANKFVLRAHKAGAVAPPALIKPPQQKKKGLRLGSLSSTLSPFAQSEKAVNIAAANNELFDALEQSLEIKEQAQIIELNSLKVDADKKARKLAKILKRQGIRVPGNTGIGGPLIALKGVDNFAETVSALDASLETLDNVRKAAKGLPHGSPVPGQKISSRFGGRKDPFTGRRAVHGGLDFKAKHGHIVRTTASGKVVKAKRLGGYGKLVEIDHGGGITTRYAHLSRISVRVGQWVSRGTKIGNVGSTGRSTGPHLHYEVRRKGRVLDPIHYVRLEKRLKPYL